MMRNVEKNKYSMEQVPEKLDQWGKQIALKNNMLHMGDSTVNWRVLLFVELLLSLICDLCEGNPQAG
jgi:hypothetical protein